MLAANRVLDRLVIKNNRLLLNIVSKMRAKSTTTDLNIDKLRVEHDKKAKRFFINIDTKKQAYIQYSKPSEHVYDLYHTETPVEFRGKGVAKVLAKAAFQHIADGGHKMILSCEYLQDYQQKFGAQYKTLIA